MINRLLTPAAAIASIAVIGILSGCSATPAHSSTETQKDTTAHHDRTPEFFGSWSTIDGGPNPPALAAAPAGIAADGTVELTFMFANGDTPPPITNAYVSSSDDTFRVPLTCNNSDERANQLFACITPRFTDPTASTDYRAVIETADNHIEGTAFIKRGQ